MNNKRKSVIMKYLKDLPHDSNPLFSKKISETVVNFTEEDEVILEYFLEKGDSIDLKFKAYYSLMVLYRRFKLPTKMKEKSRLYGEEFKNKPLYLFQMSMIYGIDEEANNLKIALQYAKNSIEIINSDPNYNADYPGFYNNYAEIVCMLFEKKFCNEKDLLEKAILHINRAIMIDPDYAKYYATLSRIQCINKEYESAKKNISKAIDLEDHTKKDYPIRLSEYQDFLMKYNIAESLDKMNTVINLKVKEIDEMTLELKESMINDKNSILEFIGFFTAIITFLISTVQISINLEFSYAISLIIVMMGCMIVAFGTFRMIIQFNKKAVLSTLIFFLIGSIFIILGIGLSIYIPDIYRRFSIN